jgi:TolB-like protein/Tfp pilus assembly protein PilF
MELLANALTSSGYSVWWDRNISGGAEFSQKIEAELMSAAIVIVAWSTASISSHWVRDEADYARTERKLLPISLDGSLPPLGFRQLHALDFSNWDGRPEDSRYRQLTDSLGPPTAAPAETPAAEREAPEPIQHASSTGSEQGGDSPATATRGAVSAKPGIAVLPLVNMSTDEEIEFLADGLTEDILTALSSNRHLAVAARTSSFAFKGKNADIREIGELLSVRYVVEGSVRKMGNRCRVTVQFIDAGSGEHVWAKKFDESLDDLLASSDAILEKIVGGLFTQLYAAEAERALHAPPESLGAWEYCQRAAISIGRGAGALDNWQRAYDDLQKAVDLAPDYPLAHAIMAWACNAAIINGLWEDADLPGLVEKAKFHFGRARELAQDDLLSLTYIAGSENFAGQQDRAVHRLKQVLDRNPSSAEAWFLISLAYNYRGDYEEARDAIDRAESLAPEKGYSHQHDWSKGQIDFVQGNYEVAAAHLERKVRDEPGYGYANVLAALCNYYTDNKEAAQKFIASAKEYNPQLNPQKLRAIIFGQPDKEKAAREYATLEKLWNETGKSSPVAVPVEPDEAEVERSGKPGVAIMPFTLRTSDSDVEFLADGLAEDIITALSANRHIRVAARAATIAFGDQSTDVREIGRQLDVRYVVEGSIRKLGQRLRIGVQFIETKSGSTIWAKNFDANAESVYDEYDEFVARIAGSLFAHLITAETARAKKLPESELGVWDYCMRSAMASGQQASADHFKQNLSDLEKALELAPESSLPHAMLCWACNGLLVNGMYSDEEFLPLLEKAKKHLRLAKSLAQDDLYSMVWIGSAENYAGLQERAIETLETVIQRNPSSAEALLSIGQAYAYMGRYDDAREAIKRAKDIAPEAGMSNIQPWYLALVEHLAGNYEEALPLVKAETLAFPAYGYANVLAAIELVLLGQPEEAPRYIARARQYNPHLNPKKLALMMLAQPDKEKGKKELAVLNELWGE